MIYLDNAATSLPKAPGVAESIGDLLAAGPANPGRSSHRLARDAERLVDRCRAKLARYLGCEDPTRLAFTLNCTDALNLAIKGVVAQAAAERDRPVHVVTTAIEHNSVMRPLRGLASGGLVELTVVGCDEAGRVAPGAVLSEAGDGTALVVISHASNVLGTVQDVAAIAAGLRDRQTLLLVDAAQSAGLLPIEFDQSGIDLLAFPGHKALLGPPGTGGLLVSKRATERIAPLREGGTGGDSASPTQPAELPHRLEAGTPNVLGLAGLDAALDWLIANPADTRLMRERSLIAQAREALAPLPGLRLLGPTDPQATVGALSFTVDGYDPQDVAGILDAEFDIAVRAGLHCALGIHRTLGTFPAGAVRMSVGPFSTEDDIAAFGKAMTEICGT